MSLRNPLGLRRSLRVSSPERTLPRRDPRAPSVPLGRSPIQVFDFGKHRGRTFQEVLRMHPSYIVWAYRNVTQHAGIPRAMYEEALDLVALDEDAHDDYLDDPSWGSHDMWGDS